MFWKTILLLAALWIIFKRWQKRRLYSLASKLKTDFVKYPIIGHVYLLIGNEEERMKGLELVGRDSIKHGGMSNFWLGGNFNVVLSDAVAMKIVLKECLEKDGPVLFGRTLVGNGSILAPVSIWRPRRKILAPTFHHKHLSQFIGIFAKQSGILVENLHKVADTGSFSIWRYVTAYAMDVVCQTTLGVHGNAQKGTDEPFVKAFDECLRLLTQRLVQPWLHSNLVYKLLPMNTKFIKNKLILTNFINKAIAKKRESMRKQQIVLNQTQDDDSNEIKSSLDMLIELSGGANGYSDLELQEEALILVLAGTDTSAVGVSFTALMLARHMDVQQKVYQELQDVFGDSDRDITFEDLVRLKYLGAVIKESLRLYPPIPVIVRKVEKDIDLPSSLTLVKGCEVVAHIWALHRNPRYWGDDAEIFNPDRFMEPLKYPNAFMPFSYGPRNCIGYQYAMLSMKTVLAFMLRKYRLLPAEDQNGVAQSKYKPIRVTYDIRIQDVSRFSLKLETRKRHS